MTDRKRIRAVTSILLGLFLVFCLIVPALVPLICGPYEPLATAVAGVIVSLVAIPFHALGSRKNAGGRHTRPVLFGISMALNTVGIAFCEAAYYIHIAAPALGVSFRSTLLLGALIPMGLTVVLWLVLTCFPTRYAGLTLAGGLVTLGGAIAALVMWIRHGGTPEAVLWSFLFFMLLSTGAVIIALYAAIEDDSDRTVSCLRYLSFASFGLFLLVAAIVLLILVCASGDCDCDCDCDCGDGCCDGGDCSGGSGGKGKRKK